MRCFAQKSVRSVCAAILLSFVGIPRADAQQWQTIAPLPTVRGDLDAATGADGRIYAIGGYGDGGIDGGGFLNRVDVYNPATNTWTRVAPMLHRGALPAAVGHPNGRIYAFGGWGNSQDNWAESYDPATNSWSRIADIPMGRAGARAVVSPTGLIYLLCGGSDGRQQTLFTIYDPATDSWSSGPDSITRRGQHGAAVDAQGRIYLWGGYQEAGPSAEMFDPVTQTWSAMPELTSMRAAAADALGLDGRLYAAGGYSFASGHQATIESILPGEPSWSSGPALSGPRAGMGSTLGLDGKIYAIGGYSPNIGYVNTVETLQTYSPDHTPPTTTASASPVANAGWNNSSVTVTLNSTDAVSGVAATYYTVGGGAKQAYTGPFTFSAEGPTDIFYWSVDKAGNEEAHEGPLTVKIDLTAPAIAANVPAPDGVNGWYVHPVTVTFDASDALSGLAAPVGPYTFQDGANQSYSATAFDNAGNSATTTVSGINVDTTAPVADSQSVLAFKATPASITLTGSDATSGVSGFAIATNPSHGTLSGSAPNLTYTPSGSYIGPDSFTFTVIDGAGNSATGTISINVSSPNKPPVAKADATTAVDGAPVNIAVLANDSDPDGDPLSVLSVTSGTLGSVTTDGKTVLYTPTSPVAGTDTFTYTITDGRGGFATGTVTVTLLVNSPPVAKPDNVSTTKNTAVSINVLTNDTDPDHDPLTVVSYTSTTNGTLAPGTNGNFVYTPNTGFVGKDTFTYTISDGRGGASTATVTITVKK